MRNLVLLFILIGSKLLAANSIPVITQCNLSVENKALLVSFELEDLDNINLEVRCAVFYAAGPNKNKLVSIQSMKGDIGYPVNSGSNKMIRIELTDPIDLNSNIQVVLSAYDREPLDIAEILKQVNTNRMTSDLQFLQGRRNENTDKAFKEKSRMYLVQNFNTKDHLFKFESKVGSLSNINYEVSRWGTQSPEFIEIIDAHYDSYNQAPGMDDNASGVTGVLEAFRVLHPYASQKTIRFVLFDLEENGLIGSNLYVNNQINANDLIDNVINFEMIGYYSEMDNTQDLPTGFNILFPEAYNQVISNNRRGDFINNIGNANSKSLIQAFATASNSYVSDLKLINLEVPGNGSIAPDLRRSDHASFWDKNYKALMITDGANFRNKNYHTIKDSLQYLNMDFLTKVVKASIATLATLAGVEHGTSSSLEYTPSVQTKNLSNKSIAIFQSGNDLILEHGALDQIEQLVIYNLEGKAIYADNSQEQHSIALSFIPTTSVILIEIIANGKKQITKMIVSK